MKIFHEKSRKEFNIFLDEIEDPKVEEEYLIARLRFFINERGVADKDGKSLRIIESAIKAKRYELIVQLLESVKSKRYFLNAFKFSSFINCLNDSFVGSPPTTPIALH